MFLSTAERDIEGVLMKAKTLTHRDVAARRDLQPSKRYRDLIVEGAKERGLEKSWIEFLEKMPYFDPNEKPLNAFEMSVLATAMRSFWLEPLRKFSTSCFLIRETETTRRRQTRGSSFNRF